MLDKPKQKRPPSSVRFVIDQVPLVIKPAANADAFVDMRAAGIPRAMARVHQDFQDVVRGVSR